MQLKDFDPSQYVNRETGEILSDQLDPGSVISISNGSGKDDFILRYRSYIALDGNALETMSEGLSSDDKAKFIKMANWLKTEFNVVFNNNRPHTLESLSTALGIHKDNTTKLVKRLVAKGLMAYVVCAPSGYTQKLYILNPIVAKKRDRFNRVLLLFFKGLAKKD